LSSSSFYCSCSSTCLQQNGPFTLFAVGLTRWMTVFSLLYKHNKLITFNKDRNNSFFCADIYK
jgi:hypothetical protein